MALVGLIIDALLSLANAKERARLMRERRPIVELIPPRRARVDQRANLDLGRVQICQVSIWAAQGEFA